MTSLVILEILYSMSTRLAMASLMRVNFIVVLTGLCILSLAQTDKLTIPIGK